MRCVCFCWGLECEPAGRYISRNRAGQPCCRSMDTEKPNLT
uniref:Uncharacterized protein n=1 Tax=Anguilla anguilla TaxID=7936 RepID=A0A0E9Q5V2_ANGAN